MLCENIAHSSHAYTIRIDLKKYLNGFVPLFLKKHIHGFSNTSFGNALLLSIFQNIKHRFDHILLSVLLQFHSQLMKALNLLNPPL